MVKILWIYYQLKYQERVDLVLCLLFFHYVSYGWLSILKQLYELLNSGGLFIVDRIVGKDEQTQILLECVDSHADQLQSLGMDNEDCLKWRAFYLNRILRKGAYWGSVIKGTDIKLIIEALEPLFENYETCKAGGCTFELNKCHLPWWWGSDSDCDVPPNLCLNLAFEFHIFRNRKADVVPESYWNLVKQNCIQTAVRNMNAILWFLKERKSLSFQDAEHFIHDVLPSIVMQLVASSGIIDYRHRITSIFIASGSLSPELQLPKLQKLFILINDTDGEGETRIQAWLNNYVIYSDILKHPLSEDFIASGKRFALLPKKNTNQNLQNLLGEFRYNSTSILGGDQVPILGSDQESRLKPPAVKQLLWWKLLEIDRSRGVEITEAAKCRLQKFTEAVQLVARQHGSTASSFSDLGLNITHEHLAPLSLLIKYVGAILFLPIPTYFECSENGDFNVRSILGLGVTVESESLHREVLTGVEDVYTLVTLLLRRFQDNYLALRWISLSRISALRSAIAAIMARNMAHHESHILPRARIQDICQRYREIYNNGNIPIEIIANLKDRLDEYLAKKQDFIAEITSEPLTTTKTAYFWQDVLAPLVQNSLFMDTIAANEGVRYDRIVLRVFFEGQEVKAKFSCTQPSHLTVYPDEAFPYGGLCPAGPHTSAEESFLQFIGVEGGTDFAVELPGPVGEHAFYVFLENLIRNAVKHNLSKLQENPNLRLEICIHVSEADEEFYKIEVSENLSSYIIKIESYLENPIIDEIGELKREAWGIAEMKIAATLLKGSTEWRKMQGDLVKEFLDIKTKNDQLTYEFYMMRPKKVCALVPKAKIDGNDIKRLKRSGVWICSDIQGLKQLLIESRSRASFKFAFLDLRGVDESTLQSLLRELEPHLPFRVVVQVDDIHRNVVEQCLPSAVFADANKDYLEKWAVAEGQDVVDPQEIVADLWRVWLKRWTDKAELHLYLGQESTSPPTSDWIGLVKNWRDQDYRPFIWYDIPQQYHREQECVPQRSSNDNLPRVVFDRHAIVARELRNFPQFGIRDSYFVIDKLSSDFIWIYSSKPYKETVYSLLEAGFLRVLVVDSRIAERAFDYDVINPGWVGTLAMCLQQSKFQGVPRQGRPEPMRWHIGAIGKVLICTHFAIDGEPSALHPRVEENQVPYLKLRMDMQGSSVAQLFICFKSDEQGSEHRIQISLNGERKVSRDLNLVDMIIIHQGDIDTRKPKSGFNYKDFITSLKRLVPFVVIDSGRGIPVEVQQTPIVKFLPYSLLDAYLGGKRVDKARLTQVVMPLTRRVKR